MSKPEGKEKYPISAAQKTLLWSEVFSIEPRKVKENNVISFYMRVQHNCNINALEFSFNELIKNNDSLRLCLYRTLRGIKQYIKDYEYRTLFHVKVEGDSGFKKFLNGVYKYRIKFFDDSLVWANIVICSKGDCALVMRMHHAAIDGYSIRLIFEQIEKYYDAYINNQPIKNEKSYSVLDYFKMQEQYANSIQHTIDRKFWFRLFTHQRKYSFPAGYRSEIGDCASENFSINTHIYQKLKSLAKKTSCTLQFLLMTFAAITTYIITGRENFCIFFASHGRLNHKLKNTIGCMMNTIPIFYDIDPMQKLEDMLSEYYISYLEMLSHGRLPLSEVVPMSYYEAFKHFFNFNPAWLLFSSMEYGDFSEKSKYNMEMIRPLNQPNQFYLTILHIIGEKIDIDLSYQTRKFKATFIRRLLDTYSSILQYAADKPEISIAQIKKHIKEMR